MADKYLREEYSDHSTMIRLYPGDEKLYAFPTRSNWRYQLLLEVTFKNARTGRRYHFGRSIGQNAQGDYCPSKAYQVFNYKARYAEAIDKGLKRCAGDNEYGSDSRQYGANKIGAWKVDKVLAVYLVVWKDLHKTAGGKKPVVKPVVLKEKVSKKKKLTAAQLEKKYPTPKKYLKAQAALKRKVKAQESRRIKREKKQRALKRKK